MENGAKDPDSSFTVLVQGFAMIIASEIGDKTFLIAAILAMRHPRAVVFAGAFGSLAVMSILSAALGHVLPTLIPKSWTQFAAAVMFFVFGAMMMQEAREMKGGNAKIQEEMREAQEEIEVFDADMDGTGGKGENGRTIPLEELEEGSARGWRDTSPGHHRSRSRSASRMKNKKVTLVDGAKNFFSLILGPVFVQAFVLTFLGEWGDRSQIATIALGAAHNVYVVSLGTIVGHACCTAVAVIGGRYVSTRISVKHVTLGGSILFLIFGFVYLYEGLRLNSEHAIPAPDPDSPADLLHRLM